MVRTGSTIDPARALVGLHLGQFQTPHADQIVAWVHSPEELFWLAPSVTPPLTAEKVVAWTRAPAGPLLLFDASRQAIGYAELNPMTEAPSHLWIGHLILAPAHRGCGRGEAFTRLILDHAFRVRRARMVSLIVFPNNRPALRCYQNAGFEPEGEQFHAFGKSGNRHRMLHLIAEPAPPKADQSRSRQSADSPGMPRAS